MPLPGGRYRVLWLSTVAFTLMFNVWLMLGVLGIPIRKALDLSDSQLEWLIATAILSGAMLRLNFGIWADRFGGRNMMVLLLLAGRGSHVSFQPGDDLRRVARLCRAVRSGGELLRRRDRLELGMVSATDKGRRWVSSAQATSVRAGTKLLVLFVPSILTLVPGTGLSGGLAARRLAGRSRLSIRVCLVAMAGLIVWLAPATDPRPVQGAALRDIVAPLAMTSVCGGSACITLSCSAPTSALSGWLPKFYIDT